MKGKIITNWARLDLTQRDHQKVLGEAIGKFMATPMTPEFTAAVSAKVREFATAGDFPDAIIQVLEKFHLTTAYDDGWKQIFDFRDFTGTNESGFDLLDVQSGLTFQKVLTGEKAEVFGMSGVKARVYFDTYGAGLLWDRKLIDDRQYWTLEDNAITFRNKAYASMAANHYALIEAIGSGQNITWQTADPAALPNTDALYTANRDAQTLNLAAQTILLAVKDKGYGVTAQNANFIVSCPLQLIGRLRKALSVALQPMAGSQSQAMYNFTLLPTTQYATTTCYYVCLPGHKAKSGMRMDLSLFGEFDARSYSDMTVGWMRYGAAIGDVQQFQRCAVS